MDNRLLEAAQEERKNLPVSVGAAFDKLEQLGKVKKQLDGLERALKGFLNQSIPDDGEMEGIQKKIIGRESPRYKEYAEHVITSYVPPDQWEEARTIPESMVTRSEYPKFVRTEEED